MQFNFKVDIIDCNECDVESEIIQEAARQLIIEIINSKNNNRYDDRPFRVKLQEEVKRMMLDVMDTDFKEEVKNSLVDDLSKKYIRTKQYQEVKKEFNILSDTEIKNGLKDIVSELVGSEMKKRFK